jgi:hypothetical protein
MHCSVYVIFEALWEPHMGGILVLFMASAFVLLVYINVRLPAKELAALCCIHIIMKISTTVAHHHQV